MQTRVPNLRRWIEFASCRIDREDAFALNDVNLAFVRGANQYLGFIAGFETNFFHR